MKTDSRMILTDKRHVLCKWSRCKSKYTVYTGQRSDWGWARMGHCSSISSSTSLATFGGGLPCGLFDLPGDTQCRHIPTNTFKVVVVHLTEDTAALMLAQRLWRWARSLTLGQVSDARPALRQRYCLLLDALLALLLPWQKTLSDSAWQTFIISAIIPSPDLLPLRHNTARLRGANKIMSAILYLKCLLSSFRGYNDVNIAQI